MRMTRFKYLYLLLAAAAFTGCEQREFCYDHDEHASVYGFNLVADWERVWEYSMGGTDWFSTWLEHDFGFPYEDLIPQRPGGIRVLVYPEEGLYDMLNISADGGYVPMRQGTYSVLMYNNGTEYILFNDIGSSVTATASTRTRTRVTYMGSPVMMSDADEQTVNAPDYLFAHYIGEYVSRKNEIPPAVKATLRPLVCTYLVRYRFSHGYEYVAQARGALAGMAGSVYLQDGHTGSDVVTVLYDADLKPWGVEARVNSFGVPDYPHPTYESRSGGKYGLNIEVMLRNGKILTFNFDVTDQVRKQPRGGVIEVDGIYISDEDGKEITGGGFDVSVDGWGDYEDIVLEF